MWLPAESPLFILWSLSEYPAHGKDLQLGSKVWGPLLEKKGVDAGER